MSVLGNAVESSYLKPRYPLSWEQVCNGLYLTIYEGCGQAMSVETAGSNPWPGDVV